MVGVPPPDGPDPGAACRRGRARSACSCRTGRCRRVKNGKQVWRYRFPDQEQRCRARRVRATSQAGGAGRQPFDWGVGDFVAVDDAAALTSTSGAASKIRTRQRSSPCPGSRRPSTRPGSSRSGNGSPSTASTATDRTGPHATCCSAARHARDRRRAKPLCRPNETTSPPRDGSRLELDDTVLPIQGPPGSGKTYTGARMICELLRAGKKVGITGTSHKVIGNLLEAVLKAAAAEFEDVERPDRSSARDADSCSTTSASSAASTRRRSASTSTTDAPTWPPGRHGCGPRRR